MKKDSAVFELSKLRLCFGFFVLIFVSSAFAQRVEHYNSPLYAPKTYDPSQNVTTGLPAVLKQVGIEQHLGEQLPLDAALKDEDGNSVKLGKYFATDKPMILALVYYECPMLCNEVLNGLTGSLKGMSLSAGKDFDVVAVSFDARENDKPGLAKNKKENYVARYGRENASNGWHFLTGTQDSIDRITKAVGFNYVWDEKTNQFAHVGGIMVATPEGKLARYFYGVEFAPRDLKLGLLESAERKISSPVDQLLLFCYHYDPATGTYGFAVLRVVRVAGIFTLLAMGAMFFTFWRRNKQRAAEEILS
jgi:protein SCO1/2